MSIAPTLSDIERWYAQRGWTVPDFQREAWAAYAAGESGLIHAPTGTGKTLAAWLGPLMEAQSDDEPIRVLWITPMRALTADTAENLQAAADALGVPWTVGVRSGDTGSSQRARQRKRLPQALVTTPESASLLLSYADLLPQWRGLRCVVVDEWHELLGTKRGVQTELVLARLRALSGGLRCWALSATLGNLDEAVATLLGPRDAARGRIIGTPLPKQLDIEILSPGLDERFPWSGHMGMEALPRVVEAVRAADSTLVFTNTRSQAERWHEALAAAAPELPMALHHGSLDTQLRGAVEEGLRSGALRCVVATSSLDLGVDFRPVSQVIQIGGPKGVARLMQRAGRSGHRPGAVSRVLCVPTLALELAEFCAARTALEAGRIESRRPLRRCLDVLAQHLVTLALAGGVDTQAAWHEVRNTHAYTDLSEAEWQWTLDFLIRGGAALAAYPQFHRLVERDGRLLVEDATIAKRHRLSIGTITSDAMLRVRFLGGGASLGHVEESFLSRLKPGESFLFAGRALRLVRIKDMTAYVRAGSGTQTVPRWQGGKMPLSSELADTLLQLLAAAEHGDYPQAELRRLQPLLELQARWSRLPRPGLLLVERSRSREGEHLFVFPFAGRHVHEGLSALLAWRLAQRQPLTATLTPNDYGFELLAPALPPLTAADIRTLLAPTDLEHDLPASLNAAEMAKRRFREIARVAGLVFEGYPGAGKSAKQVQLSSGLLYDVFTRFDPDNRLRTQALAEVLEHQLDYRRLREALQRLAQAEITVVDTPRFSPLAFPLWTARIGSRLSSEDWRARVERMRAQLESAAAKDRR